MKTSIDPRHHARRVALQVLFAWSFISYDPEELLKHSLENLILDEDDKSRPEIDNDLARSLALGTIANLADIDITISKSAPEWPLGQIAKTDLGILRLAVYELTIRQNDPHKVIIDEAVELAKEYGGEQSSKFVNGVLGSVVKSMGK